MDKPTGLNKLTKFVHYCANYNINTSTDILCRRECKLFSVRKIRHIVAEWVDQFKAENGRALSNDDLTVLTCIIMKSANYSRIGGGMLICCLQEFVSQEYWNESLEFLIREQNADYLWLEPFLQLNCNGDNIPDELIESLADKLPASLLYSDVNANITFID